jgi:hypothetical protein
MQAGCAGSEPELSGRLVFSLIEKDAIIEYIGQTGRANPNVEF